MEELLSLIFTDDGAINGLNDKIFFIVDRSFCDAFKILLPLPVYQNFYNNFNITIQLYPIELNEDNEILLKSVQFKFIVYFLSSPIDKTIINEINNINKFISNSSKRELNLTNISIVTSIPQDYYSFPDNTLQLPYDIIKSKFHYKINEIFYLPIHSIPIFTTTNPSNMNSNIKLFLLSNNNYSKFFPKMNKLIINIDNFDLDVIDKELNNNNNSIDNNDEKLLNVLSYDLSASLVYNYGLDPSNYIYALGKTSEQLGKNIQNLLNDLIDNYNTNNSTRMKILNSLYKQNINNNHSLKPCSLILIDRQYDLYTPTSYSNDHTNTSNDFTNSFAHHIYSTIFNPNTNNFIENSCENPPSLSIEKPFSALQSLDFPCQLDLYMNESQPKYIKTLINSIILSSEDKFKENLINLLKSIIIKKYENNNNVISLKSNNKEIANIPSDNKIKNDSSNISKNDSTLTVLNYKKKGFGAEVLYLIQIILNYDSLIHMKYIPLISIAFITIETMQRSSIKQFNSVIPYLRSYDSKVIFESNLITYLSNIVNKSLGHEIDIQMYVIIQGLNYIIDNINNTLMNHKNNRTNINKENSKRSKTSDNDDMNSPIDISFIITQIIRLISITRKSMKDIDPLLSASVNRLSQVLTEVIIIYSTKEELQIFQGYNILSNDIINEIITFKTTYQSIQPSIKTTATNLSTKKQSNISKNEEWEGWEDEEVEEDIENDLLDENDIILNKLKFEISDIFINYFENMILYFSNISINNKNGRNVCDMLSSYYAENNNIFIGQRMGLLARTIYSIASYRHSLTESYSNIPESISLQSYKNIESSLQHLKRAGLGLLSSGLGRLGFASNNLNKNKTKHPGNNNKIVIFVIGGISMKEIRQIQYTLQELLNYSMNTNELEIIIGSNQIFVPETILKYSTKINQ